MTPDSVKVKTAADRKSTQDSTRPKNATSVPVRQSAIAVEAEARSESSRLKPKTSSKSTKSPKGSTIDEVRIAAVRARIEAEKREQQEKESKSPFFSILL